MAEDTSGKNLVKRDKYELTPRNKTVVAISKQFNWRPKTLIRRVEAALPARVEQKLYLIIGSDARLHPESFAKLLRVKMGRAEFQEHDLEIKSIGKNLVINKISDLADYIEEALTIVGKIEADYSDMIGMSMETAGKLVLAYGEHATELLESILVDMPQLRQRFGILDSTSDRRVAHMLIHKLLENIGDEGAHHTAHALSIWDFLDALDRGAREALMDELGRDD